MKKTGIEMLIEYSTSPNLPNRSISLESSPNLPNRSIPLESSPNLSNRSISLKSNSIFYNAIKPYKNNIKKVFVSENLDLQ